MQRNRTAEALLAFSLAYLIACAGLEAAEMHADDGSLEGKGFIYGEVWMGAKRLEAAKVRFYNVDTTALVGTATSNSRGEYSISIRADVPLAAIAEHDGFTSDAMRAWGFKPGKPLKISLFVKPENAVAKLEALGGDFGFLHILPNLLNKGSVSPGDSDELKKPEPSAETRVSQVCDLTTHAAKDFGSNSGTLSIGVRSGRYPQPILITKTSLLTTKATQEAGTVELTVTDLKSRAARSIEIDTLRHGLQQFLIVDIDAFHSASDRVLIAALTPTTKDDWSNAQCALFSLDLKGGQIDELCKIPNSVGYKLLSGRIGPNDRFVLLAWDYGRVLTYNYQLVDLESKKPVSNTFKAYKVKWASDAPKLDVYFPLDDQRCAKYYSKCEVDAGLHVDVDDIRVPQHTEFLRMLTPEVRYSARIFSAHWYRSTTSSVDVYREDTAADGKKKAILVSEHDMDQSRITDYRAHPQFGNIIAVLVWERVPTEQLRVYIIDVASGARRDFPVGRPGDFQDLVSSEVYWIGAGESIGILSQPEHCALSIHRVFDF